MTGCFKDAQVTLQDEKLNITLMHGGFELLKSRHVDRCLQKIGNGRTWNSADSKF
ncbi:MAG: hypothetical protein ACLTE2_03680 [Eubacteriales bacterium]